MEAVAAIAAAALILLAMAQYSYRAHHCTLPKAAVREWTADTSRTGGWE